MKKNKKTDNQEKTLFTPKYDKPDFLELLKHPMLDMPLPIDFQPEEESVHLDDLWKRNAQFGRYKFEGFVHAGGSGIVFKVIDDKEAVWAMKIVRKKIYVLDNPVGDVAAALSPVTEEELRALQKLSHPNVVRLREAIQDAKGVVAICTTYVDDPKSLDQYLSITLAAHPDPSGKKGIHPFSPQRMEKACQFLYEKVCEIASALQHMHGQEMYHLDVKPNNILIHKQTKAAILTDMGSCIHSDLLVGVNSIRVHFTWTYAHPDLTTIVSNPQGITGGGLKASAQVSITRGFVQYDLFALGKTLQQALAVIESEFGERCHSSYGFRFLHVIACLLLDGHNSPAKGDKRWSQIVQKDGIRFVRDVALDYPPELFESHRISSTSELLDRLQRFSRKYSWNDLAPELDYWQPDIINSVVHSPAPFTDRVAQVFNHPCMRRLKRIDHLGWMREVYPGATHDRWAHSLGVFSAVVSYYNALLSDAAVPTFRILVNPSDLSHAFLAAIVHDLGQTTFGHDLEEACPHMFSHEDLLSRLWRDKYFGQFTLEDTFKKYWPEVDIKRIPSILHHGKEDDELPSGASPRPVDGVASDAINGPIDADKLDYLLRDSLACGVAYGHGIDPVRFLQALTVTASSTPTVGCRISLAFKAKGRPAVESLLLARYQMYGAVYWHHSFRCLLSMFTFAASTAFEPFKSGQGRIRNKKIDVKTVRELLYHRVVCGKTWIECVAEVAKLSPQIGIESFQDTPAKVAIEPIFDFIWQFADEASRELIRRLADRALFKRVFEIRVGELGGHTNYSAIKALLSPTDRVAKARLLRKRLLDAVGTAMRVKGTAVTVSEDAARLRLQELEKSTLPLVLIDFPTRGMPSERNYPRQLGDPERKYFTVPKQQEVAGDNVFHVVRCLQENAATIRVFAAPEFHELIVRYLPPLSVRQCVSSVIPEIPAE